MTKKESFHSMYSGLSEFLWFWLFTCISKCTSGSNSPERAQNQTYTQHISHKLKNVPEKAHKKYAHELSKVETL